MRVSQSEKTLDTKLQHLLLERHLSLEDFQFISMSELIHWRNVGRKLILHISNKLAEMGLGFGKYTYDYVMEHRDELRSGLTPVDIAKEGEDKTVWALFRRDAAKDILKHIIIVSDGVYPDPEEAAGMAVLYTDELIKQLQQ